MAALGGGAPLSLRGDEEGLQEEDATHAKAGRDHTKPDVLWVFQGLFE